MFEGKLTEIRAYNRALTAQEVRGLYKVPAASSPAEVDGDMIIDGSLVAAKITVANLAEINDDVGTITGGSVGGTTITSTKLYQGTGDWANSNTGFYLDNTGKFSLKDKLFFNPTNSRLTVEGNVTADTITVNDQLEVFGPLRASALADGTITRDHFSQDALDFIFESLATSVGGTNGDYKEASGSFTASGGTVTVGSTSDKFDHGTLSVDVEFIVDHFFYATTNYTTAQAQATLNFEVSADGTFTDLTSATKTHTLQFGEYDLSSYYGYTYLVYFLTGDVTKTFTTGTGNDLADGTDYIFRVRVDGVGSAFTGQTVPFTVEVNEGVTGVVSTSGNADTLDGFQGDQYLRSDVDDTFNANLTITGNLTVQGTQTTLNTATLQVEDKNITLNYGTGDTSGSANGAGITIQDAVDSTTDASMTWNASSDLFNFSHKINAQGDVQAYNFYGQDVHVLNAAGTGWHEWATRANDKVTLDVSTISSGAITSSGNIVGVGINSTSNYTELGSTSSSNLVFKRNNASYIQADASGGYFIFVTNGRSTSYANRALALTTDNHANFGGDVNTVGNVTVGGNLTVNGTTTTLNTATLNVEDKNIVLNYASGDTSGSANGAGITIQDAVNGSTDATILWDASSDRFEFSNGVDVENGGAVRVYRSGNSAYGELRFDTGENLDLFSSWGNKYLRLTRDGHLQLSGTTRIAHNGDATFSALNISGDFTMAGYDLMYTGGGNFDIKHTTAGQNILFHTKPSGGQVTERLRITHDGNLLVGKTSASSSVDGSELKDGNGVSAIIGTSISQTRHQAT